MVWVKRKVPNLSHATCYCQLLFCKLYQIEAFCFGHLLALLWYRIDWNREPKSWLRILASFCNSVLSFIQHFFNFFSKNMKHVGGVYLPYANTNRHPLQKLLQGIQNLVSLFTFHLLSDYKIVQFHLSVMKKTRQVSILFDCLVECWSSLIGCCSFKEEGVNFGYVQWLEILSSRHRPLKYIASGFISGTCTTEDF